MTRCKRAIALNTTDAKGKTEEEETEDEEGFAVEKCGKKKEGTVPHCPHSKHSKHSTKRTEEGEENGFAKI